MCGSVIRQSVPKGHTVLGVSEATHARTQHNANIHCIHLVAEHCILYRGSIDSIKPTLCMFPRALSFIQIFMPHATSRHSQVKCTCACLFNPFHHCPCAFSGTPGAVSMASCLRAAVHCNVASRHPFDKCLLGVLILVYCQDPSPRGKKEGTREFTTHFRLPILVVGLSRMFTGG